MVLRFRNKSYRYINHFGFPGRLRAGRAAGEKGRRGRPWSAVQARATISCKMAQAIQSKRETSRAWVPVYNKTQFQGHIKKTFRKKPDMLH
jgi:hypothetical protein